jgi:hypothetical protein
MLYNQSNPQKSLLLSGAVHYFRSTPKLWPELMRQSRDAGLNAVETITFWGGHEPERGQYNFSGRFNLRLWCEIAQAHGLGVILRPGPYTCGEINYGGFPAWLRDEPGIQFRTKNQPYYDQVRRWMDRLFEEVRPLLAPNGGPIFMVQVENEYKNIARDYGADGVAYLEWLRDLFESYDLGVPLSMCNPVAVPLDGLGWVPRTLETLNSGCANELVAPFKAKYPDDPCLWTEAWTGWYQVFGSPKRRRSATNLAFYAARFFAAGGKGINYYMWHGGTNFARDAMFLQTPSYDFDAPLDEFGQTTPKSDALAELHKVLQKHNATLLKNELPEITQLAERCSACVFPHSVDPLVFLCNDGYVDAGAPSQTVSWQGKSYHLPPETLILLGADGVLWQTTVTNEPDDVRYGFIETTQQPVLAESRVCVVPRLSAEQPLLSHPLEQLQFTRDLTDYCWYLTDIEVARSGDVELTIEGVADFFQVFVDGERVAVSASHILEDRGSLDGAGFRQSVRFECEAGKHDLAILVCALGLTKGDWMIGANMAQERKGIWGRVLLDGCALTGSWQMCTFEPSSIDNFAGSISGQGQLCWHRLTFGSPLERTPLVLDMGTMVKGIFWLNGQCLSRYWLLPVLESEHVHLEHDQLQAEYKSEPSQRCYHVPREWLREENELLVFEELGGNAQSIRLCASVEQRAIPPQKNRDKRDNSS